MKIPTNEQVKEFWGWCGLRKRDGQGFHFEDYTVWEDTNYHNQTVSHSSTPPPIDLNNLFKYAVPATINQLFVNGNSVKHAYTKLFKMWLDKWGEGYTFEDALFWAIWEVIHGTITR